MNIAFYLSVVALSFVFFGTVLFAIRKPGYSHFKHTISELGEQNAKDQAPVNYGFFLPVGLILLAIAFLSKDTTTGGLALVVGLGYSVAAFFPCDVGSPSSGSWKQQIHNLGGFIQYVGAIYFISQADLSIFFISNEILLLILIVCLVAISIPAFVLRGLAQRIAELLIFINLIKLSYI